jgi:hypothetical protein
MIFAMPERGAQDAREVNLAGPYFLPAARTHVVKEVIGCIS